MGKEDVLLYKYVTEEQKAAAKEAADQEVKGERPPADDEADKPPEPLAEHKQIRDHGLDNDDIVFFCFRIDPELDDFEQIEYDNYWDPNYDPGQSKAAEESEAPVEEEGKADEGDDATGEEGDAPAEEE